MATYGRRLTLAYGWFSRTRHRGEGKTGGTIRRMTTARRSISAPSAWDRICSGVGYHLDNLGRWLIVNAPAIGSTYAACLAPGVPRLDRKSTRLNSSHSQISYAVFCLKKKNTKRKQDMT